jgi:tetratricopeptide (TPR) repeat protein
MLRWFDYATAFAGGEESSPVDLNQGQRLRDELAAGCAAKTAGAAGRLCLYGDMAAIMTGELDTAGLRSTLDSYAHASFEQASLADFGGEYFYAHEEIEAARALWSAYLPEGMLIYRAQLAVTNTDWETATVLTDVITDQPYDGAQRTALAQVLVELAGRAFAEGEFVRAEQYWRRAITQWPDRPSYYVALSRALGRQQRWVESAGVLDEAIRLRPDYAPYYAYKAQALLYGEQFADAASAARRALELEPANEAAHAILDQVAPDQ